MMSFDFYFDESGNFEERTILEDGTVRCEDNQGNSQLVGILVPSECGTIPQPDHISEHIIKVNSELILSSAHKNAELILEKEFHATDLFKKGETKYQLVLGEFLNQLETLKSKIQPVRLCNTANLGFGDTATTYTSMYAEMVVRIFEKKTREHGDIQINLNIIGSIFNANGLNIVGAEEYKKRLNEQITFTAVRRGVAHNHLKWKTSIFKLDDAKKIRPLQICDFLSHASYKNFRRCTADQKEQMKSLFGEYDFPFNRAEVLEEIERYLDDGLLSHAVQTIAENWERPEHEPEVREKIKEQCASIVSKLAEMKPEARNTHLRQLVNWGSQFLVVRDLDMFDKTFAWLEEQIVKPLYNSRCDDVRWFTAQLLIQRLSQHNHRGELTKARSVCNRLQEILPQLAGKWEYAPLLTEAMTERAVHLNDCFEYDEATKIMGAVEKYYGDLSSLMADALPDVFPKRVRSDQRGKALGTQLQSEMFVGLYNPERLDEARRLNEMAIDEFSTEDDKRRQYQYRCQIETFAGNFSDARYWLARSLGIEAKTHMALAETIKALDADKQGFPLLHWTRIAMEAVRMDKKIELTDFFHAYRHNHLSLSPWIKQLGQEYPAHGIRRHLAISLAIGGERNDCRKMTDYLEALDTTDKMALTLIQLSGRLEVAVRLSDDQADTFSNLTEKLKVLASNSAQLANNSAKLSDFPKIVNEMKTGIELYKSSSFTDKHKQALLYKSSSFTDKHKQALLFTCRKVGQ